MRILFSLQPLGRWLFEEERQWRLIDRGVLGVLQNLRKFTDLKDSCWDFVCRFCREMLKAVKVFDCGLSAAAAALAGGREKRTTRLNCRENKYERTPPQQRLQTPC